MLRLLQGVGTGCGCLEASAGIGLCFGPIIGAIIFEIGGYTAPFFTFAAIFLFYCFIVKPLISQEVDMVKETVNTHKTQTYSYAKLLSNKRVLFANLALIVNIFQYTFIDPFLAARMKKDFGYNQSMAGVMFFVLGLGYAGACQFVYKTLEYMSFRRCFFIFFIVNGICTNQ